MTDLYNQLRELRRKLASQEGVEVFRVFNNATIDEICAKLPKTLDELLEVKGMGEKKVGKYGGQILRLVNYESGVMSQESEPNTSVCHSDAGFVAEESRIYNADPSPRSEAQDDGDTTSLSLSSRGEGQAKQLVTVSEYVDYLNLVLQKTADVKVVGEVSGSKMYPSGFYFTLKDKTDETALSCYLPFYTYRGLGIPIEDGMEVAVEGMPRLVKRNGRFQFTVENVELVGEGALKKAYDLLKAKLEAEGLFARKRELPEFVSTVGVITSRAGAVIHDFRNNLAKLGIKVYLKDVRVEGASSVGMVVEAVRWFNNIPVMPGLDPASSIKNKNLDSGSRKALAGMTRPDVIVIMRGGGSMEDIQGFNSEAVVRAVFASAIPTIVSIGHDKDVPLAQLAADIMVSTPTAAAHAVSSTWNRLVEELPHIESSLVYGYSEVLANVSAKFRLSTASLSAWCMRLSDIYKRLQTNLIAHINKYLEWLNQQRTGLMGHIGRIGHMQDVGYAQTLARVMSASGFLEQVNPERQLRLGYAIVKSSKGKVIRSVKEASSGDRLDIKVSDGSIHGTVN